MDIDREWGKNPGWFMGLDPDTQYDLMAERVLMMDPSSRVMGVHPSLLCSKLTPASVFQLAKIFTGKGGEDTAPMTAEEFAKAQGWV